MNQSQQTLVGSGGSLTSGDRPKQIPRKLYRVGEVVAYAGLSRQTIHNYSIMGLLPESEWTDGGHRLYDEGVFARLDRIAELKVQNRSMKHIRIAMADFDKNPPAGH